MTGSTIGDGAVPGGSCRLVVRLNVGATTSLQGGWRMLLAWGDLVMMHKQLLTFRQLAERHATSPPPAAPESGNLVDPSADAGHAWPRDG